MGACDGVSVVVVEGAAVGSVVVVGKGVGAETDGIAVGAEVVCVGYGVGAVVIVHCTVSNGQ